MESAARCRTAPSAAGDRQSLGSSRSQQPQPQRAYLTRLELLRVRRPKLRSLVDNLHYLFDEVHQAIRVTFRHFDSHGDGTVRVGDFLTVLAGFGLPAGADSLAQLMLRHCRGGWSYARLLDRLLLRGCGSPLSRLLTVGGSRGSSFADRLRCLLEDSEPGAEKGEQLADFQLEASLLAFLHREYLRLWQQFLQEDPHRSGAIPADKFRQILTSFLPGRAAEFSDQLDELSREFAADARATRAAGVNYEKFLQLFHAKRQAAQSNSEQRQQELDASTDTAVKIDAEHHVTTAEAATQWSSRAPASRPATGRPLAEVGRLMCDSLSRHLHRADRLVKTELGPGDGRIDCRGLETLLARMHSNISPEEIQRVWLHLAEDPSCCSAGGAGMKFRELFVRLWAMGKSTCRDPSRPNQQSNSETQKRSQQPAQQSKLQSRSRDLRVSSSDPPVAVAAAAAVEVPLGPGVETLLKRCRDRVLANWERLKRDFAAFDSPGSGRVHPDCFLLLAASSTLPASNSELRQICNRFLADSPAGRFDYLKFLRYFVNSSVFVADVIDRNKLTRDWKQLIQSFRHSDPDRRNHVSRQRLKLVLHQRLGCDAAGRELNLALRELGFEPETTMINYFKFVERLLELFAKKS